MGDEGDHYPHVTVSAAGGGGGEGGANFRDSCDSVTAQVEAAVCSFFACYPDSGLSVVFFDLPNAANDCNKPT